MKSQEVGVGEAKKTKKSKKARMKLKAAAAGGGAAVAVGGVAPVMMKRKSEGAVDSKKRIVMSGAKDSDDGDSGAKKRNRKKRKKRVRGAEADEVSEENNARESDVVAATPPKRESTKSLSFLDKMRARLSGGQFRMLNEQLYTCKGDDAFKLFQDDEGAFKLYHAGYQEQMSRWPRLPVDVVIDWLKARGPNLVVADFGCGDARLSKSVKNKVYSLDLVACDDTVIACNMANTPLEKSSVDVAVFCLSLMGVDYPSFLKEAHRVLKLGGFLLIAEVKSRFDPANDGASPTQFVDALKRLGFTLVSQDEKNKMFCVFTLKKQGEKSGKRPIQWPDLKPCIYKKR